MYKQFYVFCELKIQQKDITSPTNRFLVCNIKDRNIQTLFIAILDHSDDMKNLLMQISIIETFK